jgi:hypothetical protein
MLDIYRNFEETHYSYVQGLSYTLTETCSSETSLNIYYTASREDTTLNTSSLSNVSAHIHLMVSNSNILQYSRALKYRNGKLHRVDNIKIDLRDTGWDAVDWIDLAQDRDQLRALVNTVLNLRVP